MKYIEPPQVFFLCVVDFVIRPPPRVPRVQRPAVSRFYKKPANGARVSLYQTSADHGPLLSRLGCDPSFQLPSDTRSSALFGLLISCVLIKPLKGFTRVGRDQTSSRPFLPKITPHPYNYPSIPPSPTSAVSLSHVFFTSQSCSSRRITKVVLVHSAIVVCSVV